MFKCVHKRRLHWFPCEPLDGHTQKDTLINSLNVCEGAMHPCKHDGENGHCLWRARGIVGPGRSWVKKFQMVLWPIVMQDNPKSGNQQQYQVVLSTHRRRRWTGNKNRACWASPRGLRMSEQHSNTSWAGGLKTDVWWLSVKLDGTWIIYISEKHMAVCVSVYMNVYTFIRCLTVRRKMCQEKLFRVTVQDGIPVNKNCSQKLLWQPLTEPALSGCEGQRDLQWEQRLYHIFATSGNVRCYS